MNGIADYTVAVILIVFLCWMVWRAALRIAKLVIQAVSYITRGEKRPALGKDGIRSGAISVNELRRLQDMDETSGRA